jgi:glycosyltransferase involved in cell wall biosynthesis
MTGSPLVSIVMPVRDPDPRHFPAAIESLLAQTLQAFELIVVEDAGERDTGQPVRSVTECLARFDDDRIRHVENREPGIASARNRGIAEARAELVAMLDADDKCAPERLTAQSERMNAEPELTLLGTQLRVIDEHDVETGGRRYPTLHEEILRVMPIYNPIAQPSIMMRKAAVDAVGGYRDRTCEDYDLWSRLALDGARFANLEEALVLYRLHTGAMKSRKLRASLRDTIDIKREHWGGRQSWRGRLRLLGEHGLLLLPPRLVMAIFQRLCMKHDMKHGAKA